MAAGSIRGGRGRGSLIKRSSNLAINSVFHPNLKTCQVPRAKAVIGIRASERSMWRFSLIKLVNNT